MRYVIITCTRDLSREMKFLAGRPIIMQTMKTHYLEGSGDSWTSQTCNVDPLFLSEDDQRRRTQVYATGRPLRSSVLLAGVCAYMPPCK